MDFNIFKKGELKLLWAFYFTDLLTGIFSVIMPFWVIYFNNKGFSYTQISVALSMVFISPLLFDIPTGAIADYFGRKISVCISYLSIAIFMALVPFADNFILLASLFFLWGIFETLHTGADEAWVVDLLHKNRRKDLVHEFYVKHVSIGSIGAITAPLLGSLIVFFFNMDYLWYIQGIGLFITTVILIFFAKENFIRPRFRLRQAFRKTYKNSKDGIVYAKNHPVVFYLLMAIIFVSLSHGLSLIAWQPMYQASGINIASFGVIYSLSYVVMAITPFLAKTYLTRFKHVKNALRLTLLGVILLSFSLLISINKIFVVAASILIFSLITLNSTAESSYFQSFVMPKLRATIGSIKSMAMRIGSAVAMILGGILLDTIGPRNTIVYSSLVLLAAVFYYGRIKER